MTNSERLLAYVTKGLPAPLVPVARARLRAFVLRHRVRLSDRRFPRWFMPECRELRTLHPEAWRGLRDSITTYEEKILDGRNRFNACEKAGRKPQFVTLSGEDPYAFVTSKNLRRRNMTFEQRAFVAEAMATLKDGQRKAARPTGLPDASLPDAAKLLGVSVKSERRPPSASRPLLELVRERSVIKVSLDAWEGGGVNVTFAFWTKSSSGRPLCLRRIGIHGDELPRVVAVLRELVPEEAANG